MSYQPTLISKRLALIFSVLTAWVLSSCTVGRDYKQPDISDYEKTTFQTQVSDRNLVSFKAAQPVKTWWQTLADAQLTLLVEQALSNNYDIRIAFANIEEARAFARGSRGEYLPTVEANANANRQRLSDRGITGPVADRTVNTYEAGFDATWELDLFGRIGASVTASEALLDARIAELQSVYVSVAAEVARTYIELRGAQYRLKVAQRNLENQRQTLDLTTRLAEGGRSTDLDIARAKTQLLLTQSSLPPLSASVNAAINRLGILTGQTPDALRTQLRQVKPLPSVPQSIAVGNSASLLHRRADVRLAERELAASVAEYNVNVTALYPRIALQGSIGFLSTSFSDLGRSGSSTATFGPGLSWSVFNREQINANIAAADARVDVRLANFEQTVLEALEEVDTAMVNFSQEELRRASLQQAAYASAKATILARQRFESGIDSFLDVLDAERTQLDAEDRLALSDTDVFIDLITIYKALGGGWELLAVSRGDD